MPRRYGSNLKKSGRGASGTAGRIAAAVARNRARRFDLTRGATLLNQVVKKHLMKKFETKYKFFSYENMNLYHNCTRVSNSPDVPIERGMLTTTVGTTQFDRIGDEIHSLKLEFKLWLSNKLDRPNVMYRILVVSADDSDIPGAPTATTGLWYSTSLGGSPGNRMIGKVNDDVFRVHKDILVQPYSGDYSSETGATLKEHSRLIQFTVTTNKRIKYKVDTGTVPQGPNNYALYVIPYDSYGTVQTDNIASLAYSIRHYYKDV